MKNIIFIAGPPGAGKTEFIKQYGFNNYRVFDLDNYRKIVKDPQMYLFYKVIMSERSINSSAAEIMVRETKTMINATKALFYALQVKGIADFENVDSAAVSFAMAVNSLLDYECDLDNAGMKKDEKMMQDFIDEFCRIYGKRR